jgi:hypothetical protein
MRNARSRKSLPDQSKINILGDVTNLVNIGKVEGGVLVSPNYNSSTKELLTNLLASMKGWYNSIIDHLAEQESHGVDLLTASEPISLGFKYTWGRHFLPDTVGYLMILKFDKRFANMPDVIEEVERYLALLTVMNHPDRGLD